MRATSVLTPVKGRAVPMEQVPDPVFAQLMTGPGAAVDPPREVVDAVRVGAVAQRPPLTVGADESVRDVARKLTGERATAAFVDLPDGPGIVSDADPFQAVKHALAEGNFDDVLISTLPNRVSEWLRADLPHKVQRLGVPVTVISQEEDPASAVLEATWWPTRSRDQPRSTRAGRAPGMRI